MKINLIRLLAALCLAFGLSGAFPASPTRAATLTVSNCNDSGGGSLRQAIIDAIAGDTINFGLDCPASGPITLASSISIEKNLTISGAGHDIVISGNNAKRIFTIGYDITVTLDYLTLKNSLNDDGMHGGAIYDSGSYLTISHVTFEGNRASGDDTRDGGAIYHGAHGSLTISNSVFTNNSTTRYGGAIYTRVDTNITDSTFTGNNARCGGVLMTSTASITITLERVTMNGNTAIGPGSTYGQGGALYVGFAALNIYNSTISGNGSSSYTNFGGAIYTYDSIVTIKNSTLVNNVIDTSDPGYTGGGIEINNATLNIFNTILANNTVDDCHTSGGLTVAQNVNNLVEVSVGCGTPSVSSDPVLGALANNGGATQTHALLAGSPAINAGNDTACLTTDQRGFKRPSGTHCDIGAYELWLTISGNAVWAGVTLSYNDDGPKTTSALAGGNYSLSVPYGWSGTVTPSRTNYTFSPLSRSYTNILVDQTAQNYTASLDTHLLSVSKTGAGSGTVTSAPTGVVCGSTCSFYFDYNSSVTLTAYAATGSTFTGWSGSGCSDTGTCTVTMDTARSVTANFTQNDYTLTITSAHGTVARSPNQATYHEGDVVQLTATPDAGWTFTNWAGGLISSSNPDSVTIHGNTSITANYAMNTYWIFLPLVVR